MFTEMYFWLFIKTKHRRIFLITHGYVLDIGIKTGIQFVLVDCKYSSFTLEHNFALLSNVNSLTQRYSNSTSTYLKLNRYLDSQDQSGV